MDGADCINPPRWSQEEIFHLIEAWSEVETTTTLATRMLEGGIDKQIWSRLSRRYQFERSVNAICHQRGGVRAAVRAIRKFDAESQAAGGRLWFELSKREKERVPMPSNARLISLFLTPEHLDTLAEMGGVDKYVKLSNRRAAAFASYGGQGHHSSGGSLTNKELRSDPPAQHVPAVTPSARVGGSPVSEIDTASTEQEGGLAGTEQWPLTEVSAQEAQSAEDSGHAGLSNSGVFRFQGLDSNQNPDSSSPREHRDCAILLESMMQLQNEKLRRAARVLQTEVELRLRQLSEMVRAEFAHRAKGSWDDSDATYVARILVVMEHQVSDLFARFEENCDSFEEANRRLVRQHLDKLGL